MLTVLVDYDSGNLHSAEKAFQRMAVETGAGEILVSSRPEDVARADRIVLPGDGAFPACRKALGAYGGLFEAIEEAITTRARPFLGICVGMQMMATWGREYEDTKGFDWIPGEVVKITPANPALKVPHMGWNTAEPTNNVVFDTAWGGAQDVYFVHSFAFRAACDADVAAWCIYGADRFAAAVQKDNIMGVQFHPEKSQRAGLALLEEWLKQ